MGKNCFEGMSQESLDPDHEYDHAITQQIQKNMIFKK